MKIAVLGAGSFGTSLAVHLGSLGHEITLWARNEDLSREIQETRKNESYLPEAVFPETVVATSDLARAAETDMVLVVVPSQGFRGVVRQLLEARRSSGVLTLVSCTKGIESDSHQRMSEVAGEEARKAGVEIAVAVLSGPSFAAEIVRGVPTAAVIAATDRDVARHIREAFSGPTFRLYSSPDVTGVEVAGTSKNVIAIASGAVAGLELGQNTMAALITRGLHEIVRLGTALGGHRETFSGLAGLGDLVLTCTGGLSRNRRVGLALAEGKSAAEIQAEMNMVAEGIRNTLTVTTIARELGLELPITEQMHAVIYEGKEPRAAVVDLMTRELKSEATL